jgi:ATP-dependent exoDNAse (exonuclease V) beta subunit
MKPTYLAKKYAHPMDERITFDEPTHIYTIDGDSSYTSVTTFLHHNFPSFDKEKVAKSLLSETREFRGKAYPNKCKNRAQSIANIQAKNPELSVEQATALLNDTTSEAYKEEFDAILKQWLDNSSSGTITHADIENFYNEVPVENDTLEYKYFQQFNADFQKEHPNYRPYRTEWTVFFKDLKIAGSIDMVYENIDDGTLMIYDWKRVKSIEYESFDNETGVVECLKDIPHTNFWHYSLQLNTYKAILESQYGKRVTRLMLVRLYPTATNYELHECADMQDKVKLLFEERSRELK